MKLLGWMHRKFRQNSSETPKDFPLGFTGQPSLEELQSYQNGSYCSKTFSKYQSNNHRRSSFASLGTAILEEEDLEEEPAAALSELFHGFLAIGTLGREPITMDPGTPTFSISVDHIAEKETEATENELKLINDELEKVLGREESCNASSGRSSHVSAGRISHCSTITLGGKPIESAESYGNEAIVCPLQSYLLGSAIGMQETASPMKRENRTSLGELFQKTKVVDENSGSKLEKAEKRLDKEADKSAANLMKKMLKRTLLHASSKNSNAETGGAIDSATAAIDSQSLYLNTCEEMQILQIFSRKVHPESSTFRQQSHKPTNNEIKNNINLTASNIGGLWPSADDITIYPEGTISKDTTWSLNNHAHPSHLAQNSGNTSGNEFWVKTDADYLVLEL